MLEMYVAADRQKAYIESQPYLGGMYAAYASWVQDKGPPGEESLSAPYQDLAKDRFLLGPPDNVVSELRRCSGEPAVNMMIFRMQWPGILQEQVQKQTELLGGEVMPRVKGLKGVGNDERATY